MQNIIEKRPCAAEEKKNGLKDKEKRRRAAAKENHTMVAFQFTAHNSPNAPKLPDCWKIAVSDCGRHSDKS
jgi:hypothetical protein